MDDFNSTEITEEVVDNGEQTELVDQSEDHDFDLVEDPEDDGKDEAATHQSREDNHAAKLARLKAERDARKRESERQAEEEREWENCEAVNPLTGNPFRSKKEFFEYNAAVKKANQQKRAETTGRTVAEIEEDDADRDYIRKKRQEETSKSHEDFIRDDLIAFMEAHPEVDVEKLDNNKQFRDYCGSRYGKEPLADLYDGYKRLVKSAEQSFKSDTRAERSTGAGATGGERMTAEQKRNLDAWNAAFPEMKMTPSEFLRKK